MRLIATALAAACIASAHAATIPASAFAERNQFSDATLSPDGKHIAVNVRTKRGDRDVPTLTIYSLPDLKIVSQMGLKGYEMMFAIEWVSNERLVAHKAMEIGLREAPAATGEIVAMDLNGSHFEYLYGYNMFKSSSRGKQYMNDYGHGSVARVPIEKNDHVFVSAYDWEGAKSRVFDINSRTAVRKELANLSEEGFDFVLQDDGTPRFAYGSDNDDNPVLYRADARDAWKKLPNDLARDLLPFGIQPDNKSSFAWLSKNNGPRALARYDLATGATTVLGSDPFASVGRLEWSFGARSVPIAWHAATGKPTVTYIDPADPDAQIHKMLAAQFPGLDLYIINDTLDGKKLLFWVGSDRDPGSYYLFDRTSGKADLLFSNLPNIDPEQMAERRPIRYTARDGLTIEGYLTLPANPTHKKLPLIVMPHGGPIGPRDTWYFDSDAQFLASRGYAVLQPNFRGSGGRGKAFQEAGFRQWGGKMIDDMVDGMKWAAANADIDLTRVCTYGASYGGYAAMMLPIREPGMFKCAIGYAGRYEMLNLGKDDLLKDEKGVDAYFRKTVGTDQDELKRQSPAYNAERVKVPVLLVHGGKDKRCPPYQFELMRDNLAKAGNTPDTIFEPDEGHGFFDAQRRIDLYNRMEAFLAKYLGN